MNRETSAVIHIPQPLHKRLKAEAQRRGCFMQRCIEEAITNWLSAAETAAKQSTKTK